MVSFSNLRPMTDVESLKISNEILREENGSLQEDIEVLRRDKEATSRKAQEYQTQITDYQTRITNLEDDLKRIYRQCKKPQTTETQEEMEQNKLQCNSFKAENERLQQQLQELKILGDQDQRENMVLIQTQKQLQQVLRQISVELRTVKARRQQDKEATSRDLLQEQDQVVHSVVRDLVLSVSYDVTQEHLEQLQVAHDVLLDEKKYCEEALDHKRLELRDIEEFTGRERSTLFEQLQDLMNQLTTSEGEISALQSENRHLKEQLRGLEIAEQGQKESNQAQTQLQLQNQQLLTQLRDVQAQHRAQINEGQRMLLEQKTEAQDARQKLQSLEHEHTQTLERLKATMEANEKKLYEQQDLLHKSRQEWDTKQKDHIDEVHQLQNVFNEQTEALQKERKLLQEAQEQLSGLELQHKMKEAKLTEALSEKQELGGHQQHLIHELHNQIKELQEKYDESVVQLTAATEKAIPQPEEPEPSPRIVALEQETTDLHDQIQRALAEYKKEKLQSKKHYQSYLETRKYVVQSDQARRQLKASVVALQEGLHEATTALKICANEDACSDDMRQMLYDVIQQVSHLN